MTEQLKPLPEEMLHDPQFKREYVAVRVDRNAEGMRFGTLIAHGSDAEETFAALRKDQVQNPSKKYYFAKPISSDLNIREHWSLGVDEQ